MEEKGIVQSLTTTKKSEGNMVVHSIIIKQKLLALHFLLI